MRISDWSSDVCSSDLPIEEGRSAVQAREVGGKQRDIGAGVHAAQMIIRFDADFIVGHLLRSEGRLRANDPVGGRDYRSEEHTSELQSLMRISYAVFCLKKKRKFITQQLIDNIKYQLTTIT